MNDHETDPRAGRVFFWSGEPVYWYFGDWESTASNSTITGSARAEIEEMFAAGTLPEMRVAEPDIDPRTKYQKAADALRATEGMDYDTLKEFMHVLERHMADLRAAELGTQDLVLTRQSITAGMIGPGIEKSFAEHFQRLGEKRMKNAVEEIQRDMDGPSFQNVRVSDGCVADALRRDLSPEDIERMGNEMDEENEEDKVRKVLRFIYATTQTPISFNKMLGEADLDFHDRLRPRVPPRG